MDPQTRKRIEALKKLGVMASQVVSLFELRQKSRQLIRALEEVKEAQKQISALEEMVPICSNCKKIRDDKDYWHQLESYLQRTADIQFTHGMCPECQEKFFSAV